MVSANSNRVSGRHVVEAAVNPMKRDGVKFGPPQPGDSAVVCAVRMVRTPRRAMGRLASICRMAQSGGPVGDAEAQIRCALQCTADGAVKDLAELIRRSPEDALEAARLLGR